jgi:hypothetical protein
MAAGQTTAASTKNPPQERKQMGDMSEDLKKKMGTEMNPCPSKFITISTL